MKHVKTFENFSEVETTNEIFGFSKKEKWNKLTSPSENEVDEWFVKLFDPEKKHALGIGGNKKVFDRIFNTISIEEKMRFIEEALKDNKDYIVVYGEKNIVQLRELKFKSGFTPAMT